MKNQLEAQVSKYLRKGVAHALHLILLFHFLLAGNLSQAQSFTQFTYKVADDQNIVYEGLLTVFSDGSSNARVKKNTDAGENPSVFELLLKDSVITNSTETLFLVNTGMADISKLTDAQLPHRSAFEFKPVKGATGVFYTLSSILVSQNGEWRKASNFTKTEYEYTEIGIDLVNSFYSKDDPFYIEYFSAPRVPDMAGRGGLSTTDRKRKIHLIIVADLNDATMGASCRLDMENMTNTFSNIAKEMKLIPNAPVITRLTGSTFNKSAVLKAVNGLKPGKNDIVIFYFTGHGFRDSGDTKSALPRMILSNNYRTRKELQDNSLPMQDIVAILQKKSSSFNLVMNDCCNVEVPLPRSPAPPSLITPKSIPSKIYSKNFERLFLKPKGTLVLSSASPKQYSVGNDLLGGFFTWHFRVALGKSLESASNDVSWDKIFVEAGNNAHRQAKSGLCPKDSEVRCFQVPQMFPFIK